MVPPKETAEEQLLRMIEGPGGGPSPRGPARSFSIGHMLEHVRLGAGGFWRWNVFSRRRPEQTDAFLWRLRLAGYVLWVVLAGLGIYLVVEVVLVQRRPPSVAPSSSAGVAVDLGTASMASPEDYLKPLDEYQAALASHSPFSLEGRRAPEAGASQGVQSRLTELTGSLSIVGINRGRVPEALIEDTSAQRTYFVKVGDQVNGLTVKAINQDGVVVSYEGDEITLK